MINKIILIYLVAFLGDEIIDESDGISLDSTFMPSKLML